MSPTLTVTEEGRSGQVLYREDGRGISFYWEFGGNDIVTSVAVGTEAQWASHHAWALPRRAEILRFVAAELVRQKAPTCRAEIDDAAGWIHLRRPPGATHPTSGPLSPPRPSPEERAATFVRRFTALKAMAGLVVLVLALVVGAVVWLGGKMFKIRPGKGTPIGLAVRTEAHVAVLIQSLEPYVPSLHRDHSLDRYSIGLFVVPLDGGRPELVPISGGHSGNSLGLVKILGSDGRTLWYDVNGTGGVDLETFERVDGEPSPAARLQGGRELPLTPRIEEHLAAGYFVDDDHWLGLLSAQEVAREFAPKRWLRRIASTEDAKVVRRFHRGTVGESADRGLRQVVSMEPIDDAEYLNAAFLRLDEKSEPIRMRDPEGALWLYTSAPGQSGTLVVARADDAGRIVWTTDTGLDRFLLQQILPGATSIAYVGTRPPVPDQLSEPLLVIVENATGKAVTHSLWR